MTIKLQLYTAPARIGRPAIEKMIELAHERNYAVSELTSPQDPNDRAALHVVFHINATSAVPSAMQMLHSWAAQLDSDQLIDLTIHLAQPRVLLELTRPAAGRSGVSRIALDIMKAVQRGELLSILQDTTRLLFTPRFPHAECVVFAQNRPVYILDIANGSVRRALGLVGDLRLLG